MDINGADLDDWILWSRQMNDGKRTMTIYVNRLTSQERERLAQLEEEFKQLCHRGSDETKVTFGRESGHQPHGE